MKNTIIFVSFLLLQLQTFAATTQLNALCCARADGTDQTAGVQTAVNQAAASGVSLYVPPGIVYTASALTNTATVLIEDYVTPGIKTFYGEIDVDNGDASGTNTFGGATWTQLFQGPFQMSQQNGLTNGPAVFNSDGFLMRGSVSQSDGTNTSVVQLGPFTPTFYPVANGTNTLTDGYFYSVGTTNIGFNGQFIWGPNTTNTLSRSNNFLVWTNGATGSSVAGYRAMDADGNTVELVTIGTVVGVRAVSPSAAVGLFDSSGREVRWFNATLMPTGVAHIGQQGNPWTDVFNDGSYYTYGFISGTNYSRNVISITGSNAPIIFNNQTLGTAGAAKGYKFQTNGVDLVKFDYTSTERGLYDGSGGVIATYNFFGSLYDYAESSLLIVPGVTTTISGAILPASDASNHSIGAQAGPWTVHYVDRVVLTPITKVQKTALTPAEGMLVMQSDTTPGLRIYQSGAWRMVSTVADP